MRYAEQVSDGWQRRRAKYQRGILADCYLRRQNVHHGRFFSRAIETGFHFLDELHDAVFACIKRVVFCADHIPTWNVFRSALADDDLAHHHFLAVLELDAQTLRDGIAA